MGGDKSKEVGNVSARICQITTNAARLAKTMPILPGIESAKEVPRLLVGRTTGEEAVLNSNSHYLLDRVFLRKVGTKHSLLHDFLLKKVPAIVSQPCIFWIQSWVILPTILGQVYRDDFLDHARSCG